ncbi:MAG: TIM barrel protein [Planctomycetota bacterium]
MPAFNRREIIQAVAAAGVVAATQQGTVARAQTAAVVGQEAGRIHQSVVYWCFHAAGDRWDIEKMCRVAKQLGCQSIELAPPETWPTIQKHGLTSAIAPNGVPGAAFMTGFNNPRYHGMVIDATTKMIDACAEAGFHSVIAFTGYKWRDASDPTSGEISPEEGADNCVKGFRQIMTHAEKKNITVCLEHLNSRDASDPMKGHPGYQGDDVDYVAGIIRRVGSERLKMLFDIYHVQVMNGDVIRRIEECKDVIGHVHTAGNPGRGELDDTQEINYPPIMRKLLDIGYKGFVGQEFIPTGDPLAGLQQAVRVCDVLPT